MRAPVSRLLCLLALIALGSSAPADTLVLVNGDQLNGEIIEWAVDHVVIEHAQLGALRIALDQLKLDTGEPPSPGLFGTGFLRGWSRRIDVGINGEKSDDSSANVNLGSKFSYKDPWTSWRFNGRYFYSTSSDDDDDDNNATVNLGRDWLIPESRWYLGLSSRYQFDQFEAWEHRITLFGGPGLHLVETEKHTLDLRVGPAFTREFGTSNANQSEAAVALSYDWKISERQSLELDNQYFYQLSSGAGDWRNFSTLAWSLRLTARPALSLNLGVQNEVESDPEDGDSKNDLKYFMTLGLDL